MEPAKPSPQAQIDDTNVDPRQPGSEARFFGAVAAAGLLAVVWAVVWALASYSGHADLAIDEIVAGGLMGLVVRGVWGRGGGAAAATALSIAMFSLGLGHLILYMHYANAQQAADDIGIAPSFRSVMAHFGAVHWASCAAGLVAAAGMALGRRRTPPNAARVENDGEA